MNNLGLSAFHEANLRLLANNGLRIPDDYEKFNMSGFRIERGAHTPFATAEPMKDGCGTAACMVGHAPFLGISLPRPDENWEDYALRVFGVEDDLFDFLFGGFWAEEEHPHNTARACASRILFVLDANDEFIRTLQNDEFYLLDYPILDPLPENDYVAKLLENAR